MTRENSQKVTPLRGRPGKRTRYTQSKSQQTEHISFRAPLSIIREIDEIVAGRYDEFLRTRSDVLNDAVALWLETWFTEHPDKLVTEAREFFLSKRRMERERRDSYIQLLEDELEKAIKDKDAKYLRELFIEVARYRGEAEAHCSPAQLEQLQKLHDRLKEILW